jgi:ABC-type lipoprotein export system ATPase subunit
MKIKIEQLRHAYAGPEVEERTVLAIDAWSLEPGEQVLLRGISGSGKTTLLNILAGLLRPTSGSVWVGEQQLYALSEAGRDRLRAQSVGYIFQTHLLVPNLTAVENVEMPLAFTGNHSARARRLLACDLLTALGLEPFARRRPAQLSAGQRLRVAVARALVNQPKLLLADEPTAALDSEAATVVMELIQSRCQESGAILLVASHDPLLDCRFEKVCDLRAGQLYERARNTNFQDERCSTT